MDKFIARLTAIGITTVIIDIDNFHSLNPREYAEDFTPTLTQTHPLTRLPHLESEDIIPILACSSQGGL
jgi:hypothetical protein